MNASKKQMEWLTCFFTVNLMLECFLFKKLKNFNEFCSLKKEARMSSTYIKQNLGFLKIIFIYPL